MARAVSVEGAQDMAVKLSETEERSARLRGVLTPIAERVARQTTGVPVATGALARSIKALEVTDQGFKVGSELPYARYVFHGTSSMDARPPKVPAFGRDAAKAISDHLDHG